MGDMYLDFSSFLNSHSIAEYWKTIGFFPNAEESAFLVYRNRNKSLKDKKNAYRKIISDFPDQLIPERRGCRAIPSLRKLLKDLIRSEECSLAKFLKPGNAGYRFSFQSTGGHDEIHDHLIYTSFDDCLRKLQKIKRIDEITGATIIRRQPGNQSQTIQNCIAADLNSKLEIAKITDYGRKLRNQDDISDFFVLVGSLFLRRSAVGIW